MLRLCTLLLGIVFGLTPALAAVEPPRNGEELIRQMRDRYDGKWYRTLTFVQKTTLPNGTRRDLVRGPRPRRASSESTSLRSTA